MHPQHHDATPELPSLRTELLATIAILATMALLIAVSSVVIFYRQIDGARAALWLSLLIVADVVVFVAVVAHQFNRFVAAPLGNVIDATRAIAGGDLSRRVAPGGSSELAALAGSINRMTDSLLAEHARRVRAEKLAGLGRLAAGVAHEIGNPLGAINGYSHLLRARLTADPRGAEALDGIERESGRIDRIVRGLLDYARPRRRTPARIDVNDAVAGAARLLADQGVLRRIELTLTLEPRTPYLGGERHELEQMLVNLLLNATDAMQGAGRIAIVTQRCSRAELERTITRRADDPPNANVNRPPSPRIVHWLESVEHSDELLKLVVADSGPGIAEQDVELVFDPFYTTKEPGKGTGLGLAIVARVVEDLRGTIWVQRAREGGAAFHALFPLASTVGAPVRAPDAPLSRSGQRAVERR